MTRPTLLLSLLRTLAPLLLAAAAQAGVIVSVTPAARQLKGGGTCTLAWEVTGTPNKALKFEIVEPDGGAYDAARGLYTAPRVTRDRVVHVRGTSEAKEADPNAFADAEIWVLADRVELSLPGKDAPGDVAEIMAKMELFGPDWLSAPSARLPFLDLATGRRLGDPKAVVTAWVPDPATREARIRPGINYYNPLERFYTGYGLPFTLAWTPMKDAEEQVLSCLSGTEASRVDVTGLHSHVLRVTEPIRACAVEALRPGSQPGTWISDIQRFQIRTRGLMPLAGSPVGHPGHEDGVGPSARFQSPSGLVYLNDIAKVAVADPDNHDIRLVAMDGTVQRLCGQPRPKGGHRDGTGAEARFLSPSHLAAGRDPAGDAGGPLGPYCLYVVDSADSCIRWIRSSGRVETYAGVPGHPGDRDGDAGQAQFRDPQGIGVLWEGSLVVADRGSRRLRRIIPSGPWGRRQVVTLAGSGLEGSQDGPAREATFTGLGDLCVDPVHHRVFLIDGHAVREFNPEHDTIATTFGSVTQPGFRDRFFRGGIPTPAALRGQPCLNQPTSIILRQGALFVLDAGNQALRAFTLWSGTLETLFRWQTDVPFRYGLFTDGIQGPLPPGFAFAAPGAPRALCLGQPDSFDFILATEHRLALGGRGLESFLSDLSPDTTLRVGPPVADRAEAAPLPQAEAGPGPMGLELLWRKEPVKPALQEAAIGPCVARFRIADPHASLARQRFFYTVQFIDPGGAPAQVASGECVAGQEVVVPGQFTTQSTAGREAKETKAGQDGEVLLTWIGDSGYSATLAVPVRVR